MQETPYHIISCFPLYLGSDSMFSSSYELLQVMPLTHKCHFEIIGQDFCNEDVLLNTLSLAPSSVHSQSSKQQRIVLSDGHVAIKSVNFSYIALQGMFVCQETTKFKALQA